MNATERVQSFEVKAHGLTGMSLNGQTQITVDPAQAVWVVVRVDIPYGSQTPGSHPFQFDVTAQPGGPTMSEKSVFFVPR